MDSGCWRYTVADKIMATLIQCQISSIFVGYALLFSQVDLLASPVVAYLFDLFALAVI